MKYADILRFQSPKNLVVVKAMVTFEQTEYDTLRMINLKELPNLSSPYFDSNLIKNVRFI